MKKQSGFGAVQIALIVVVLVLASGAGWYVWQQNNKDEEYPRPLTQQEVAKDVANLADVSVNSANLPTGWTVEKSGTTGDVVLIRNTANQCYINGIYATPEVQDIYKSVDAAVASTIGGIEQKGNKTKKTSDNVEIVVNKNTTPVTFRGASLEVSGMGPTMYQTYTFYVLKDANAEIWVSCPAQQDLDAATKTASLLNFNKL